MSESKPKLTPLEKAYRQCFGQYEGVLTNLLSFCGVFAMNLETEALAMARNEGRRQVGLFILQMLGEVKTQKI